MKRPTNIHNEEAWREACRNIVTLAERILRRELGIIEGARRLCSVRFDVKEENDPNFLFFVGIVSQTDHLPVDNSTQHWNPHALDDKTAEIQKFEKAIAEKVFQACRNLIQKYGIPDKTGEHG